MTKRHSAIVQADGHQVRHRLARAGKAVSGAFGLARTAATTLLARVPGTLNATQAAAHGTASALQSLPDSTLRGLAASSVGLGAGFYLAGAPRPVIAAGITPALIMAASMALRPSERATRS
jgi:hypothetical protein